MRQLIFILLVLAGLPGTLVCAETWEPVTGADRLRDLVAGATARIELRPGAYAVGEYKADGTASIRAWGATFARTWAVHGDDQVCYTDIETRCYRFEANADQESEYRAIDAATGEVFVFTRVGSEARSFEPVVPPVTEGGLGTPSAAEIAAQLANPNTALGSMNTQFDYIAYQGNLAGADNAEAWRMLFQPSLPYPLTESTNLFVRPAIPVVFSQDVPRQGGGFTSAGVDLGDIAFDASIGKTLNGGVIILGGIAGTLPTATDDALGLDQWLLGPEALLAVTGKWGVLGLLVSHQWDVAGEDAYDTSITGGQLFYTFNLGNGWQVNGAPTFSYNHEASSGNRWTLPLAIGVSRTAFIGGRPWKFGVQYWHYIESPDNFGPDYQFRFTVSPVIQLPW